MDFKDQIFKLSERINDLKDNIATEEATKTAFILPLIAALGYDVFNPLEVIPELDCDLTKNKGEKIDYAIIKEDTPIILIECKHWKQDLNLHNSQLQKYFVASNARFGVLTNGIEYRFYTDLEKSNIMDKKPFFVLNMDNITDADIEQIKKFHKNYYNEDGILSTAQELKYTVELKKILTTEFETPSNGFTRYFAKQIYEGAQVNQRVIDQFRVLIKKSITDIINENISERLEAAIKNTSKDETNLTVSNTEQEHNSKGELPEGVVYISEDGKIVTTQEEIDAYHILKAILCKDIDPSRITYKDTQNYFRITIDNNNRKTICLLSLGKRKKYLRFPNAQGEFIEYQIDSIQSIYNYASQLQSIALQYKE